MPENKYNSLRIGFFIFIGFLLFVAAILILGRKRNMFKPTINISTVFRDVRGLKVGNNVRFTGIEVGTIVAITILSDTAVNVEMSMERQVIPYIKKNSVATIGNDGLMGNKIVSKSNLSLLSIKPSIFLRIAASSSVSLAKLS